MSEGLTVKEVATQLERPLSTVKRWIGDLGVPHEKDAAGARRLSAEAVETMRRIGALLDNGRHMDSVRIVLGPMLEPDHEPARELDGREPTATSGLAHEPVVQVVIPAAVAGVDVEDLVDEMGTSVADKVIAVLEKQNELAEKYARATFEIGELRERVRSLEADRMRLVEERQPLADAAARLVPLEAELTKMTAAAAADTSARTRLLTERERLTAEVERADQERARLEAELQRRDHELAQVHEQLVGENGASQARPWWRFWN